MYDLVIEDAQILDGTGAPAFAGDVAVAAGRIAAVGKLSGALVKRRVKADGLALAPGLIDVHTHYDAQLTWEPTASPSPALGVTTVVMGNCGFGIAPCPPATRDLIACNLSEVEGMPLDALRVGIDWSFESFADYLALLRRKGSFPNVAVFVGHSTLRSVVMGPAGSERAARGDEIARMRALVGEAIEAGAIGFASSQSQNHNGHGGVPMPSRLADDDEIASLAGVLGEKRRGLFQITVGPTTSVAFLESIALRTGRPVVFSALFHNDAFPERAPSMLAECRAAQARGHRVYAQVACQPLSMDFTLANAYPMQSLECWSDLRGADSATLRRAFVDPGFRARMRGELAIPKKGKLFYGDWHKVEIAQVAEARHRPLEGQTVARYAAEHAIDPLDGFFDLALAEDLATGFNAKLLNTDETVVESLLRDPASLISLSDAGAHLTYLCDAGFGLSLLGHWTRERGSFTLAEAVHQLTGRPAAIYGLAGRGRIRPGDWADLFLFDPARVEVGRSRRVFDLPTGAGRLIRDPIGVHGVWVNGVEVFDGRDYTRPETAPGRLLDRFAG